MLRIGLLVLGVVVEVALWVLFVVVPVVWIVRSIVATKVTRTTRFGQADGPTREDNGASARNQGAP